VSLPYSNNYNWNLWKKDVKFNGYSLHMYKILNGQMAVPEASVDLILSSRPTRGTDANQQQPIGSRM